MNVAFIPVRGGSKSIPLKNIKPICGKPLVYWTVKAAQKCKDIDVVYVSTDSEIIRTTVEKMAFSKVKVISRSEESASDTASTESAMLEFAEKYQFDHIVLIQATSPLLLAEHLEKGFEVYNEDGTESVLSVVRQKRFHWAVDKDGYAYPTNYDVFNRPRRQEYDGYLVENGAFYITSRDRLLSSKNRVSGNIRLVEMPEETFFEIDEPSDWLIIEEFMKRAQRGKEVKKIKMVLSDCDGCLTDGGMYYSENGDELKRFNTRDGMAFSQLKEKGIIRGIVTGERVKLNQRRADKLQLDVLISGCKDKVEAITKLCEECGISLDEVLYVGDDINDVEILKLVGISCCPADAREVVRNTVDYVANAKGGEGVIREIVDHFFGE